MAVIDQLKEQAQALLTLPIVLLTVPILLVAVVGLAVLKQFSGNLSFRVVSGSNIVEVNLDGRQPTQPDKQLPEQ